MALIDLYSAWAGDGIRHNDGEDYELWSAITYQWDTATRQVQTSEATQRVYQTPVQDTPPADYSKPPADLVDTYTVPSTPGDPGYDAGAVGLTRSVYHDGGGIVRFTDAGAVCDLQLIRLDGGGAPGTSGPVSVTIQTSAIGPVQVEGRNTSGASVDLTSVPAGSSITVTVTDANGCQAFQTYTVPAFGCTDPEASNYDARATSNNGSCTYSPRLLLDELPPLVAVGRPVNVTLHSEAVPNATPAPAFTYLNLETMYSAPDGLELVINGYRLVKGPLTQPNRFTDTESLLDTLQGIPALAAAYLIRQSQDDELLLTARVEGTPGNLTITSDPFYIGIYSQDGVNRYRSQARAEWGVFLEVWCGAPQSNPSTFADLYTDAYRDTYGLLIEAPTGPALPVLAQRLELPYREDNNYSFDIAPALRQFVGHAYPLADGSCPDRLTSYFLKYGEVYASPGQLRRPKTRYQSGVAWALDAVELVPAIAANSYVLTRRPWPVRGYLGQGVPFLLLGIDQQPAAINSCGLRSRTYDGNIYNAGSPPVQLGKVYQPQLTNYLVGPIAVEMELYSDYSAYTVAGLDMLPGPVAALTFANGQGGFDTVAFEGTREEITKRVAADYGTATGLATRSASTPEAFRLNSGPLTRAEYLWLRRELGNTPDVYLETETGPVPVVLTALAFDADEVKAEYSLAVDCTPAFQPALGLTN